MNKDASDLCKKSQISGQNEASEYTFKQQQTIDSVDAAIFAHNNLIKRSKKMTVDQMRKAGIEGYKWVGSKHYKSELENAEPLDLMNANDTLEGFCIGGIIKYAFRFTSTRNLKDLEKIIDYAHILYGRGRDV